MYLYFLWGSRWPFTGKQWTVILKVWPPDLRHVSITWEHVRKANSQVCPRPTESEVLEVSPAVCVLSSPSGNSDAGYSVRTTVLRPTCQLHLASSSFGHTPRREMLHHITVLCLTFSRSRHAVFHNDYTIYSPRNVNESPSFSVLKNTCYFLFSW